MEWAFLAGFGDIASGKDDGRSDLPGARARCRQLAAVQATARLDRITRRAHTLSPLLVGRLSTRAADMQVADDLMPRVSAALAQKRVEPIAEPTRATYRPVLALDCLQVEGVLGDAAIARGRRAQHARAIRTRRLDPHHRRVRARAAG